MSFKDLNLKREYRSYRSDIINEFYIPVLNQSVLYRRAVGFFSSSALSEIMKGISGLYENGGKIQLIASPKLSEEDIEAINLGYKLRKEVIEENLISQLEEAKDYFESERLNILAHLIANNRLDIKIAVLKSHNQIGIYHEKLGLVYDNYGNEIAFTGSLNETANALLVNYESIDVFTSWKDNERVNDKRMAFENIWNDNEEGLEVLEFPKVKEVILQKYKRKNMNWNCIFESNTKYNVDEESKKNFEPRIPKSVNLYDYQIKAIDEWEKRNFKGIFDMATGTGKTFTALAAICRLYEKVNNNLAVIIVCPYQHLVEQWVKDIKLFNMSPIVGYSTSNQKNWKKRLENSVKSFNLEIKNHFCFVTTNATFSSDFVKSNISELQGNILLIIDEAHNFGTKKLSSCLNKNIKYRLALSATLERRGDEEGTNRLLEYFGEKCIEYTLEEAISNNKLTPYYYYPIVTYLSDDELKTYIELSKELTRYLKKNKNGKIDISERGKILLIKRARIVAGAIDKVNKLYELMDKYKNDSNILVYCGATTIQDPDYIDGHANQEEIRQIEIVTNILGNKLNMKVAKFTSEESAKERENIKKSFENEDIQAIVAIKCLDEGVNIPGIKIAFILASSTNPKEYIQRRGRVLRKFKGKDRAIIFDFITLPIELEKISYISKNEMNLCKSLVKKEIIRIRDFASTAENPSESDKIISNITEVYDIKEGEDDYVI